jgi:ribosomal protein S18 acetylase RimI-like enzyme
VSRTPELRVEGYLVRRLGVDDIPALQDLFGRCVDHFLLHDGQPPEPDSAAIEFGDVPPGRTQADKHLHGIFERRHPDRMIGLVESVSGYPDEATWFLGLLLIDPAWRRRGLGSAALTALEAMVVEAGYRTIRLAVIEPNREARRFWVRHGFRHEETRKQQPFGRLTHGVEVLVRAARDT